jgi:hypothetical protein
MIQILDLFPDLFPTLSRRVLKSLLDTHDCYFPFSLSRFNAFKCASIRTKCSFDNGALARNSTVAPFRLKRVWQRSISNGRFAMQRSTRGRSELRKCCPSPDTRRRASASPLVGRGKEGAGALSNLKRVERDGGHGGPPHWGILNY